MPSNLIASDVRGRPAANIPASVPCILFTLVAAALAVVGRGFPAKAPHEPAAPPPLVETRLPTVGQDENHRYLPFTVYVLTQQLSWRYESQDGLEGGGQLLDPALIAAIQEAPEVFCVGTASLEGATRTEEARAAQRAGKLAGWVGEAAGNAHTRIFTLNAGQYKGPRELLSSSQRKVIILITGPHDQSVNLSEALRSGLERMREASPVVDSLLCHYSRSNEWLKHLGGVAQETRRDR